MNIAVVYSTVSKQSGLSAYTITDTDTEISAKKVAGALRDRGAYVTLVPIFETSIQNSFAGIKADCIFNLIEWTGNDLPLAIVAFGALDLLHIPYTGVGKDAYITSTDKILMKQILDTHQLPTPVWQAFSTGNEPIYHSLPFPVIIKPSLEHCSIGLSKDSIVKHRSELQRRMQSKLLLLKQPCIAEEFISGREYHIPFFMKHNDLIMLPPCEIRYTTTDTDAFLTYESRWNVSHPEFKASKAVYSPIGPALEAKLFSLGKTAFRVMNLCDYARLDVRVRDGQPYILEANSNPGLDDDPEYEMTLSSKACGLTFTDLVWLIVESCLWRQPGRK